MSVPRSVIDLIFLDCFGQLVEILIELQVWIENVRFCKIEASGIKANGPWLTWLGDRGNLVRVHVLGYLAFLEAQDVEWDLTGEAKVAPLFAILGMDINR